MVKTKKEEEPEKVIEKKPEIIERKQSKTNDEFDEELEEEYFEEGNFLSDRFNYPIFRRAAPTIRIQPIAENLEIELDDIPTANKKEENNTEQYKPLAEKNYSLNQEYKTPGSGASYENMIPKTISSPQSPTLTPNFSDPISQQRGGFGNQNNSTTGYPGQSNERQYDSGLEQQTQQDKRRRDL